MASLNEPRDYINVSNSEMESRHHLTSPSRESGHDLRAAMGNEDPAIKAPNGAPKLDSQKLEVPGYASHIVNLVKSSGIYALASMASPLISLVLAPFLTHHLSRPDYGALAVLNTTVALLAGISQLGLGSAFFRSYNYDYESRRDRSDVISTVVILLALISIPTSITAVIAAPWLTTHLLNSSSSSDIVRFAGLLVLLQNLTVPGFAWLRAENRAGFYSILSIAILLINLGATIVLVGISHMGIAGSLIATEIGYAVVLASTLPLMLWQAGI